MGTHAHNMVEISGGKYYFIYMKHIVDLVANAFHDEISMK